MSRLEGMPYLDKRSRVDCIVAAASAPLWSIVIAVAAFVIIILDGFPPHVALPRAGRHGERIRIVKLRTMRRRGKVETDWLPVSLGSADPRITRAGVFLRQTHLDELPQLVRVAGGRMALIGPRPEDPSLVPSGDDRWCRVLECRPGITGVSQVLIAHLEPEILAKDPDAYSNLQELKLRSDAWYADRAAVNVDAWVLVGTLGSQNARNLARRMLLDRIGSDDPAFLAAYERIRASVNP